MNNDARFSALKQRVGGNREVMGYEMTFGMPRETQWHITPRTSIRDGLYPSLSSRSNWTM